MSVFDIGHCAAAFVSVRLLLSDRWPVPIPARAAIAGSLFLVELHVLGPDTRELGLWAGVLLSIAAGVTSALGSNTAKTISLRLKDGALGLFSASCLLALVIVFLHGPSAAYCSSPEEFGIAPDAWVVPNLQLAMQVAYPLLLAFAFAVSPRLKSFLALFAFYCAATVFLYAYLIPFGYPMMAGLSFERSLISSEMAQLRWYKDIAIAAVIASLTTWIALKTTARKLSVAVLLLAISLIGISGATLLRTSWKRFEPHHSTQIAKPYVFSKEKPNVLIVFLDRFMSGFVEQILSEKPDLVERLDGFTWYPKTVSAGYNSITGTPPVFGGYDYLPHILNKRGAPLVDLTTESFRVLPMNFTKRGYEVNFVDPRGLGWTMAGDCRLLDDIEGVRCSHTPPSVTEAWAKRLHMKVSHGSLAPESYVYILRRLGGMRGLPYLLKDRIYDDGRWQPGMLHAASVTFAEWAKLKALPERTIAQAEKPQFNVVWNILPHEPYYIDTDCRPSSKLIYRDKQYLLDNNYSSLREFQHYHAAKCSLVLIADYFDQLKALGVYDNTRIVIVSDHGIVGGVNDRSSRAVAGGTTDWVRVSTRSALWVKHEQAHGPMRVDETFMPGADVPRIVCEQIGGCTNPFLNDKPIDRHGRHDPFVVTYSPWQFNRQKKTEFTVLQQDELVGGAPFDKDAWRTINQAR